MGQFCKFPGHLLLHISFEFVCDRVSNSPHACFLLQLLLLVKGVSFRLELDKLLVVHVVHNLIHVV